MQTVSHTFNHANLFELANLCGSMDCHLRAIETALNVVLIRRGEQFSIQGDTINIAYTQKVLDRLFHRAAESISLDTVNLELLEYRMALAQAQAQMNNHPINNIEEIKTLEGLKDIDLNLIELKTRKVGLQGRSPRQRIYIHNILNHDISLGVGAAGTGKTYLAVACALDALERDCVKRIVLTRPAVEAGERLGFLPGDLSQKIDPYLRPLYDALYDLMGAEKTQKLLEKQIIEIAPLAYMRGRTLSHAFIILDEAQNTRPEQMKMFLTRLGFGSKVVITGDVSQVDLPKGVESGLNQALSVLKGLKGVSITHFDSQDVVRHQLVSSIVDAYQQYEYTNKIP
jgi:phosphate starvation-inducible protein PhoH and related proteins